MKDIELDIGNAHEVDTQGTGWFVGFSPWTLAGTGALRHMPRGQGATGLCMKWFRHPAGHDSGGAKPLSEGRTVSVMAGEGGEFVLEFSREPDFSGELRRVVLARDGDFAAWGAGLYHRWRCVRECTVATLRWNPAQ